MDKGWLRETLQESMNLEDISSHAHLTNQETMVMTLMNSLLSGSYISIHRKLSGHVELVCHALGIHKNTRKRNLSLLLENNFLLQKPVSARKKKTIFNDKDRRKQVFTGFNVF